MRNIQIENYHHQNSNEMVHSKTFLIILDKKVIELKPVQIWPTF